ncbi:OB-fold nucleic acid binding domain protein [[Clostridium] sordellii ATCC 9714]|nr:OB-fold nucleic acid binding domain protein [[Clostridium] sordellii ATCC 9714] [Paeniclostridium sordellii ATCC 9714]
MKLNNFIETKKNISEKTVKVAGWIRTSRSSKNFGFIELNDGSFFKNMQIVISEDKLENFKEITKLPISSSILVEGELVSTEGAKQPVEIQATKIEVEGESDSSYPLQKKRHTLEYLRTIAHLRPRSNTFSAVFRVRSLAAYAYINSSKRETLYMHIHQS